MLPSAVVKSGVLAAIGLFVANVIAVSWTAVKACSLVLVVLMFGLGLEAESLAAMKGGTFAPAS